jgi:hypothetical protein
MKRLRFVWIDDKKDKVEAYRAVIEAGLGNARAALELIEVKSDALAALSKWSTENKSRPPDLFVIDHIFNATLPFALKGSSVAHLLRSEFSLVPMVCVTAMFDQPNSFDQEDISEYTALFLYQHLEHHIEDLYAIAKDFRKLHPQDTRLREHIVACLKPPSRDKADLLRLLPEEFEGEMKHATTGHRVARWIFNVLLRRPGFVYDRLHAATLLGLTEAGFKKVESQFESARYKGVFATGHDPRWWASAIRKRLYDLAGENAPDLPQYAGRTLKGIKANDYSVCYVSRKSDPPPDAVVAADISSTVKQRVVCRQYSEQHPSDPGITPGFETRLILKKTRG